MSSKTQSYENLRTRFAPSPTGYLHLGHLASAMAVHDVADMTGAEIILRLEDNDFTRSKPEFADSIVETLKIFGFEYSQIHLSQRSHFDLYRQHLTALINAELAYPCHLTRAELRDRVRRRMNPVAQTEAATLDVPPPAWRLDVRAALRCLGKGRVWRERPWPPGKQDIVIEHDITEDDIPSDPVLWRRDGVPSYILCSTIDDARTQITHVVRGEDTRQFTASQSLLHGFLQTQSPLYIFHPLIRDENGEKLAKRKNAKSLADLLKAGLSPADLKKMADFRNEADKKHL